MGEWDNGLKYFRSLREYYNRMVVSDAIWVVRFENRCYRTKFENREKTTGHGNLLNRSVSGQAKKSMSLKRKWPWILSDPILFQTTNIILN